MREHYTNIDLSYKTYDNIEKKSKEHSKSISTSKSKSKKYKNIE